MGILPGIIKSILDTEDSYLRFERFCLDIYSETEGVDLVPTSRTWDLGRDGRSISTLLEGRTALCATLERDIDDKVRWDIKRIAQTARFKAVVYCTSKLLSEQKCEDIESTIREEYPSVETVQILGQIQLTSLAERHDNVFRKHYAAEIDNLERTLFRIPSTIDKAEDQGLRLALLTHASDDAETLKKELAARLILDTLSDQIPRTPAQLAGSITALLHLPRTISTNYIGELVVQLVDQSLVSIEDNVVKLTELGVEKTNTVEEEATVRLLEGRIAVRDAIGRLTGNRLADSQFNQIWNVFQDGITDLFYSHGLAIIKMIRSALGEEEWKTEKAIVEIPLEKFADRVVNTIKDPQLRQETRQAIIDMFFERDSGAFNWLTQVCGIYVMMCSLGFETLSSEQIEKALSCYWLVPDSDIVLSLLCIGEDNHDAVERILSAWKAIGGKLFMIRPILEEVAYHAWISDYDYASFGERLASLSDQEARKLIDNAFVRAFRKEAGSLTHKKYWDMYINQFKGNSEYDYGYVLEHLRDDYGFGWIAEETEKNIDLTDRIRRFLINRLCEYNKCQPWELDYKIVDKSKRDARLVTAVHNERQSAHTSGEPQIYCVVTSARVLKQIDNAFRNELREPEMVFSLPALGFLLTLTPQVRMSFSTLRSILFDTYLATRLTPIQRFACRAIAASGQWDLPWSRRVTLQRQLRRTILDQARLTGEKPAQVRARVLTVEDAQFSAQVVADALDKIAITPRTQDEIRKLRTELKKIQEEKRKERSQKKAAITIRSKDLKRLRSRKKRI